MPKHASLGWSGLALSLVLLAGSAVTARAQSSTGGGAWLGVYSQALTPELRDGLDYRGGGVLVNRVVSGSPAEDAGIEKGDVIESVNARTVDSPDALARVIQTQNPGARVSIRVFRDGARRTLTARLADRDRQDDTPTWSESDDHAPGDGRRVIVRRKSSDDEDETPDSEDVPGLEGLKGLKGLGDVPSRDQIRRMVRDGLDAVPARGRLGVQVQDLKPGLSDYFGTTRGALVMDVLDGTPAERGGIRVGDVILRVGDTAVANASDLIDALRGKEGRVTIELMRRNARRTVEVTLEARRAPRAPQVFRWRDGSPGSGATREPRVWIQDSDPGSSKADLERELSDLRKELEQLRREMEDMKRGK